MTLFWTTDEIIAGKWRVKKPMPLELVIRLDDDNRHKIESVHITLFGKFIYGYEIQNYDREIINELSKLLKNGVDLSSYSANSDAVFLKIAKEYLEEIPRELNFNDNHFDITDDDNIMLCNEEDEIEKPASTTKNRKYRGKCISCGKLRILNDDFCKSCLDGIRQYDSENAEGNH